MSGFRSTLSLPQDSLEQLELELCSYPTPYSLVYDSDDGETRSIRQRLPKMWCSQTYIMNVRSCGAHDLQNPSLGVDLGGVNGWITEMTTVERVRRVEDGGKEGSVNLFDSTTITFLMCPASLPLLLTQNSDESDSDSDSDVEFWDCPRPVNRRPSCTVNIPRLST